MDNDPFYSESNIKALLESIQQAKERKVIVKTMEELERITEEDSTIPVTYDTSGIEERRQHDLSGSD